jgi:hypothetical protein
MTIYFMKPARRGASDATRRRIVGDYLAERARRRWWFLAASRKTGTYANLSRDQKLSLGLNVDHTDY